MSLTDASRHDFVMTRRRYCSARRRNTTRTDRRTVASLFSSCRSRLPVDYDRCRRSYKPAARLALNHLLVLIPLAATVYNLSGLQCSVAGRLRKFSCFQLANVFVGSITGAWSAQRVVSLYARVFLAQQISRDFSIFDSSSISLATRRQPVKLLMSFVHEISLISNNFHTAECQYKLGA